MPADASGLWRKALLLALLLAAGTPTGSMAQSPPPDLAQLSLEELMELEVTLASRRSQPLADVPAAIFVITRDDLRRSGATTLPEALRLAPGLMVASVDSGAWALTARGFQGTLVNKLQVLQDGRSLYTPLFAGVFWDIQELPMAEIERIEVVRGPGATVWGSNAVNGVINIVTRPASETPGSTVSVDLGTQERLVATALYGGAVGERTHYRLSARWADRDSTELQGGGDGFDAWQIGRIGLRLDSELGSGAELLVRAAVHSGSKESVTRLFRPDSPIPVDSELTTDVDGGYLQARWSWDATENRRWVAQSHIEVTRRDIPEYFNEELTTLNLDLLQQHTGKRHELVSGIEYRLYSDRVDNSFTLAWVPEDQTLHLLSAFVQDESRWLDDRLRLTAGIKLEHNDYTGFEIQPNLRWLYRLAENHSIWASASRAIRSPSRVDRDARVVAQILPGAPPTDLAIVPNDVFEAEELRAFEAGYRAVLSPSVSIDLAVFHNRYDDLQSIEAGGSPFLENGRLIVPFRFENRLRGESQGFEALLHWNQKPVRLDLGISLFNLRLERQPGSPAPVVPVADDNDPGRQVFLRASWDLAKDLELTALARYVSALEGLGVDSYTELDIVANKRLSEHLTLRARGRNLLDSGHVEFASGSETPHLAPRAASLGIVWSD